MHVRLTVHKTMITLTYLIVTLLNTGSLQYSVTAFFFNFIKYYYTSILEYSDLQYLCT
jgi:hypothetical protein